MKKLIFSMLLAVSTSSVVVKAQMDVNEATIKITDFSEEAFSEGTNEFSSGSANRVKLTYGKTGSSNTFSITQANTFSCDGDIGSHIASLAYSTTNQDDHAYIQVENTGTSNITHVAVRGWYNVAGGNNMLTYGYSTTTDDESEFMVPMSEWGWEDTPLYFDQYCSIGETFDETSRFHVPEATYIRISSSPYFPNLPMNVFGYSNTNVAVYGIYIWTDDQGIPSGTVEQNQQGLKMTHTQENISFSLPVSLQIHDLSARVLLQEEQVKQASLQKLGKGVYIMTAKAPNGETITKKIYR
ncbi:MAG: hypothetical protein LUG18_15340 [Candidatus Azobacteroides sp.]|nr:hypothetical protein [Candidatus Azobacteroides sp.]